MYTSFETEMPKLQVRFCRKKILFVGFYFFLKVKYWETKVH